MNEFIQQKRLKGVAFFQQRDDGRIDLVYEPTDDEKAISKEHNDDQLSLPVRFAIVDPGDDKIVIFPKTTLEMPGFLRPKYGRVTELSVKGLGIDLEDILDSDPERLDFLPKGFLQSTDYGLGLAKELKLILDFVQNNTACTKICLSGIDQTGVRDDEFVISFEHFETARKKFDRIQERATEASQILRNSLLHNLLGPTLGLPAKPVQFGRHQITNLVGPYLEVDDYVDEDEREKLIDVLSQNARLIASQNSQKLFKLTHDLEVVALEVLIQKFEASLESELPESYWQKFFSENPFALQLVFGYPIIIVQEQAFIGGRKLDGSGEKITDYLAKNSANSNCAIIEIKTPQMPLLTKSLYRASVYGPSRELSGSVVQTLDQAYQFQRNIFSIKENTRDYELNSYMVHCCLIAGTMPTEVEQAKSFELYRSNSKGVLVTTFDELCGKLRLLHQFLSENQPKKT